MKINSLNKLIRDLEKIENTANSAVEKIEKKYQKEVKNELEYIAVSAVEDFYDSYDPDFYDRWGDLYNAFKVVVNDKTWEIQFGSKFMQYKHRATNEYIYNLAFQMGYHGGAWNGSSHPFPGQPWVKNYPYGGGTVWIHPAARAKVSPYLKIRMEAKKYLREVPQKMQKEFEDTINPHMDALKEQVKKAFS